MSTTEASAPPGAEVALLPTSKIQVHTNPRKSVDEESQSALVDSITQHGVITPITVRRSDDGEGWTLIAGQRRLLAALTAGLEDIPAIVLEKDELDVDREQAIAMVENLHRDPLKPTEEASAFKQAAATMSHAQIAAAYTVSEHLVRDRIEMLAVPESLHPYIDSGAIPISATRVLSKIAKHSEKLGEACAFALLNDKVNVGVFASNPPHAMSIVVRAWNAEHPDDLVTAFNVTDRDLHEDAYPWTDEQKQEIAEVADFVRREYSWTPLLNETDVDLARTYGALLEIESSDGVDSAWVTDPDWLLEHGTPALERKAEEIREELAKRKTYDRPGSSRKKKKAEMNEAELAEYAEQREAEKREKDEATADNEKLGANLMSKFKPKMDKRTAMVLALLIGEKWADTIGRGCRYVVPELRTVTEKRTGGARIEYVSAPDAYQWWLKRLKRLKSPDEIIHHVMFGIAASEFVDEKAVPQSARVYATPAGYIDNGDLGKQLLAITRAQVPDRMKKRADARIAQEKEDLKRYDVDAIGIGGGDDEEFDPETGEYL